MSHRDFTEHIEAQADAFDAADEAMLTAATAALEGTMSIPDAEATIDTVTAELMASSTAWVNSVLPAVVVSALRETDSVAPMLFIDDMPTQAAALELAADGLADDLHNTARQMARDARRQMRVGFQIRLEEEVAAGL